MPTIAHQCDELNHQVFGHSQAFVDKSIFKAKGGIWHKNHIKLNIIPHKSIDSEASWGFSPYHKWRFGYGLHLIANENRFPIVACVTTAKIKDYLQVPILLNYVSHKIGVLVGDAQDTLSLESYKKSIKPMMFCFTLVKFLPKLRPVLSNFTMI